MKDDQEQNLEKAVIEFLTREKLLEKKAPPSSVLDFYKLRREIYEFVISLLETRISIVNAPVKVGKKDMVIFNALFSRQNKGRGIVHFYVTALMRNEIKEQADQLEEAGVIVLTKKKANEKEADIVRLAIQKVLKELSEGREVIIHFDESDYGTDFKSKWSPLFNQFIANKCCSWILYSATNEEAELSKLATAYNAKIFRYNPPETYRGAKWFLEQNLVYESKPFFHFIDGDMDVTEHGSEILEEFLSEEQKKPVIIIRHSTGNEYRLLTKSGFKTEMIQHKAEVIFVDKDNDFDWADGTVDAVNRYLAAGMKTIILLNQKATRATETYCQENLYGFHDHRKLSTNYNTYAQSSLRVAHYDEKGHQIKIWTSMEVIKKAAGLIGNEEFLNSSGRNISNRVGKSTKIVKNVEYNVYNDKQDVPPELFSYRGGVANTSWTVSKNKEVNLAQEILNGIDLSSEDRVRVIHIDGPNQDKEENISSFEELKEKYPELIGKWITHGKIEKTKKRSAYTKEGQNVASIFNKIAS